jgi:hypothetical protein
MIASDPVEDGLVSSFKHPGENVTGEGYLNAQVAPKRLELLHEAVPAPATITLLVSPANPVEAESQTKELQAAAPAFGSAIARDRRDDAGRGRARIYGGRERWQRRHSAERRSAVRPAPTDGGNTAR